MKREELNESSWVMSRLIWLQDNHPDYLRELSLEGSLKQHVEGIVHRALSHKWMLINEYGIDKYIAEELALDILAPAEDLDIDRKVRTMSEREFNQIVKKMRMEVAPAMNTIFDLPTQGGIDASSAENKLVTDGGQDPDNKISYVDQNNEVSGQGVLFIEGDLPLKMSATLSNGFDPKLMMIGSEMAGILIEAGTRKYREFASLMINEIGDPIRPYLKSLYVCTFY